MVNPHVLLETNSCLYNYLLTAGPWLYSFYKKIASISSIVLTVINLSQRWWAKGDRMQWGPLLSLRADEWILGQTVALENLKNAWILKGVLKVFFILFPDMVFIKIITMRSRSKRWCYPDCQHLMQTELCPPTPANPHSYFGALKAIVFPVVIYGCQSWTIKTAEHRRIDAFELWR